MDLVKLSAAGGIAAFAALAALSTTHESRAEAGIVGVSAPALEPSIQARIGGAFRATEPAPASALTGPLFPIDSGAPPAPAELPRPSQFPLAIGATASWTPLIEDAARRFGIPPEWVHGVMQVESGGRTTMNGRPITSSAGAMGLMQVMPGTFAELTARYGLGSDPFDPRANIMAGAAYLREMYDRYGPLHFLAAYNAGPARVDAHLRSGRPLPAETQRYTAKLLPRLFSDAAIPSAAVSSSVQDLTAPGTMRASSPPCSRSLPQHRAHPASAPIFVTRKDGPGTPPRQPEAQPNDGLFVTLKRADRRQMVAAADPVED